MEFILVFLHTFTVDTTKAYECFAVTIITSFM